jgi:hypothetical protein
MRVQSVAFSLTVTLCLAFAAAGLAYVAGQAAADPEGRYEQGVDDGERLGATRARTDYAPGSDGYRAIFDRGRMSGERTGRRIGRRDGARRAEKAVRDRAFGRFDGGWEIGRWYLVNIRPGDDGARYAIGARVAVNRRDWYRVCRGVHVCRKPVR